MLNIVLLLRRPLLGEYVMRCTIWYNLYNLKNVKNIHVGMLQGLQLYEN